MTGRELTPSNNRYRSTGVERNVEDRREGLGEFAEDKLIHRFYRMPETCMSSVGRFLDGK
jgi:hypothetical protein